MSKKFDKKLTEIEDWLDDFSDALDDEGYSVVFQATKRTEDDVNEWYSYTDFPIGMTDDIATLCIRAKEQIGYESLAEFMEMLTKYASMKDNVLSGRTSPAFVAEQHDSLCEGIMNTYYNSAPDTAAVLASIDKAVAEFTEADDE